MDRSGPRRLRNRLAALGKAGPSNRRPCGGVHPEQGHGRRAKARRRMDPPVTSPQGLAPQRPENKRLVRLRGAPAWTSRTASADEDSLPYVVTKPGPITRPE